MLNDTRNEIWNVLCNMTGEEVAQILTNIHGTQILDDDVRQELVDLGMLEDTEED